MEGTQDSSIDKLAEFDIWSFFGDDMGIHDDLTRGNIDGLVVFFHYFTNNMDGGKQPSLNELVHQQYGLDHMGRTYRIIYIYIYPFFVQPISDEYRTHSGCQL